MQSMFFAVNILYTYLHTVSIGKYDENTFYQLRLRAQHHLLRTCAELGKNARGIKFNQGLLHSCETVPDLFYIFYFDIGSMTPSAQSAI